MELTYAFALLAAAFFWGTTFVAQSIGADHVGPFTFLATRSYIGVAVLLPLIFYRARKAAKTGEKTLSATCHGLRHLLPAGISCGILLFLSSGLQQYGIAYTTTAKSSFITALYVVLVPLLLLFTGKRPGLHIWASVGLCVAGLYLLCLSGSLSLDYGDIFMFLCALGFALQILCVNHYSGRVDGVELSASQFFVEAILATVCMLLFEHPTRETLYRALPAILYAGILSNGVAFTLQIIGQQKVRPALASLIMCLESVFGALSGWLILHETLSFRQFLGCAIMLIAIILASIGDRKKDQL